MTSGEWGTFMLELTGAFRGEVDRAREAALRHHVGEEPLEDARAALRLLVEDGLVFLPVPAEVVGALRRLRARRELEWPEAWPAISAALRDYCRGGRTAERRLAMVRRVAEECGEGAARFAQALGPDRLAREPVDDPDHGGAVLHRLRGDFEACRRAALEDGVVGRALERAAAQALGRGRGPRRLELGR